MVFGGLPEPVVRHTIRRENGDILYRFDLCYREFRLLFEYDGRHHAESTGQWTRDLARREWLDQHGWRLIVVTAADLRDPEGLLTRLRAAMTDAGMPPSPSSERWRHHFRAT